jgi:alkylhydroperoxidase family enzyme
LVALAPLAREDRCMPAPRYRPLVEELRRAVLESDGRTPPELRAAVAAGGDGVPPALAAYVEKVRRRATEVGDGDFTALAAAGFGEDEVFELTVAAALGAALRRLDAGLAALDAASRVPAGGGGGS